MESGILAGDIEEPEEEAAAPKASNSRTIHAAVDAYLTEVKATKGDATWRAYSADLAWFEKISSASFERKMPGRRLFV